MSITCFVSPDFGFRTVFSRTHIRQTGIMSGTCDLPGTGWDKAGRLPYARQAAFLRFVYACVVELVYSCGLNPQARPGSRVRISPRAPCRTGVTAAHLTLTQGGPGSNPGSGATYADVLKRLKRSLPKSDRQATARGFKSYHRRHKHEWRNGNTRRTKDPVPAEGL